MALRDFSREELIELFNSRLLSDRAASNSYLAELKNYLDVSLDRLLFTVELIKRHYHIKKGKILEIGSFPFFLTTALLELSDDEITGIIAPPGIWPGMAYEIKKDATEIRATGKYYHFTCWTLNVEKDRFPFNDKSFDMVLCTEVIEHLIQSPAHMIWEMNRVLKDNGLSIITTPNGLYWRIIYNLLFYGTWEHYSKYGVYSRHNRLWALSELEDILAGNNFEIHESICNYAHLRAKKLEFATKNRVTLVNLVQDTFLLFFRLLVKFPIPFLKKKDGDQLYVIARKIGRSGHYCPECLNSTKFCHNLETNEISI